MPLSFSSNRPPIILKQCLHIQGDSSLRSHSSSLKLCLFFHVLHILHTLTSNLRQALQTHSLSSLYQSRRKNPDSFFLIVHRLHFFSFFISIAFSSRYLIRFFSKLPSYLSSSALGHLLSLCSVLWHIQQEPVEVNSVSLPWISKEAVVATAADP